MMRMMQIWKTLTRSLIKLYRYLFPCSQEVQLSHSMSSKLQEKALPKKAFLIHTDILQVCGISKQGLYPKTVRSRNARIEKFSTIPTWTVVAPDGIYVTYLILMTILNQILIHQYVDQKSQLLKTYSLIFHNESFKEFVIL